MLFYESNQLSRHQTALPGWDQLQSLHAERQSKLFRKHWEPLHSLFKSLPDRETLEARGLALEYDLSSDAVTVGPLGSLSREELALLKEAAQLIMPWRKGPFQLFDLEVDAEWRSHMKWDRVLECVGSLEGQRIADVGCGNGYYMFRALAQNPELVVGLDPSEKFFHAFHFVQRLVQSDRLDFLQLGVEEMPLFGPFFDTVLCMGIIYHQKQPIKMLRDLMGSLKEGGLLVLETMGVPGREPMAMAPPDRYSKSKNVYYLPTASCMLRWMERAGYRDVKVVSEVETPIEEQRRTEWMVFESLANYLNEKDRHLTVEGYSAPLRFIVTGRKV